MSKKNKKEVMSLEKSKAEKVSVINEYRARIKKLETEIIQIQTLIGYISGDIKILEDEKKPEPKKKKAKKKDKKK